MTFLIMSFVVGSIVFAVGSGFWVAAALIKTMAYSGREPDSGEPDAGSRDSG